MGTVKKKFSKRHKHTLSKEEKLNRDLKSCMRCKYFWGNNIQCTHCKCYKEKKQQITEKKPSKCDGCSYNKGTGYCFPCMKDLLAR